MENQFKRKLAAFMAAVIFTTSLPVPAVAEDSAETIPAATVEPTPEITLETTMALPKEPETVTTTVPETKPVTEPIMEPVTGPVTEPATEPATEPEEQLEEKNAEGTTAEEMPTRVLMMLAPIQDNPVLAAPVVTAPDSVKAGEEVTITWEPVENAEEYVVMLYWGDGTYIGDVYYGAETSATISRQLEAGEYSVTVLSRAEGWENGGSNISFTVIGELAAPPVLTLDAASYTAGSKVTYAITAEKAEAIRLRYYGTTEDGYNSEDTYEFAADGTTTIYEKNFYTAGNFNAVCSAKVNGIWSAWSEPVPFTVAWLGELAAPVLSMKENYAAGEEIMVSWTAVTNAEGYNIFLYDNNGKYVDNWWVDATTNSVAVETVLEAGTYQVSVRANADGWKEAESEKQSFVVAGILAEGPSFTVDKTSVVTGNEVTFTVSMDGATAFRMQYNNSTTEYEAENGTATITRTLYGAGDVVTVRFSACIDGIWTAYGPAQEITIQDKPTLGSVNLVLPENIRAAEEITITWTAVENAEYYYVNVNTGSGNHVWSDTINAQTEDCTTTIPGTQMKQGTYVLTVTATAAGYNQSKTSLDLVVGAPALGNEFRCTFSSDGTQAYMYEYNGDPTVAELEIPATINGATVVGIYGSKFLNNNGTLKKVTIPKTLTYIANGAFAGSTDLTIRGYSGSDAEEFALLNGYRFEALDGGETSVTASWEGNILVNSQLTITISAAGATDIRMIVDASVEYPDSEVLTQEGAQLKWTPPETGEHFIRFEARINDEWVTSRNYPLTVTSLGQMPQATDLAPSATTVEPGTEVTLTWKNPEGLAAPEYSVGVKTPAYSTIYWYSVTAGDTGYTFRQSLFDDEGTYTLYVRTEPSPGYEESVASCTVEVKSTKTWDLIAGTGELVGYHGTDKDIIIPAQIDGIQVKTIGSDLFAGSDITSVVIPEGVTSISYSAFENCDSLTSVTVPSTLGSIGMYAFENCASLQGITLPDALYSLGMYAFSGCGSLTEIVIPGGITKLEDSLFADCSKLSKVTLPDSLISIGYGTFARCTSLKSITIPQSVTTIQSTAFANMTELTICGYSGTVAETFAEEQGFTFVALDAAQTGEISFALKSDTVYNHGNLVLTVTAPKAEKLRLHLDGNTYEYYITGGKAELSRYVYGEGQHTVAVSQQVEGKWLSPCEAKTFTVTELGIPEPEDIGTPAAGTALTIRWKPVTGAVEYTLFLDYGNENIATYSSITAVDGDGYVYQQVTGEELSHEGLYTLSITAWAADKGQASYRNSFEVIAAQKFTYTVNADGTAAITGYTGTGTDVTVPETLDGYTVTAIGADAFRGTAAVNVTLPDTLTVVKAYAFRDCGGLESVSIPGAQAVIEGAAFDGCTKLTSITVGQGIFAESGAFGGCRTDTIVYGYAGGQVEEEAKESCKFSSLGQLEAGPVIAAEDIWQNEDINYAVSMAGASKLYIRVVYPDGTVETVTESAASYDAEAEGYDFDAITESCTVTIRAFALVGGKLTAYAEKQVTVSVLGKLTVPVIPEIGRLERHLDHVICWEPVENAQGYVAELYKGDTFLKRVELDDQETEFAVKAGTLEEADYTITVTAKARGYEDASSSAEFEVYEVQLEAPVATAPETVVGGVRFDVSWTDVEFAEEYQLEFFAQDGRSVYKETFDDQTLTHTVTLASFLEGSRVTMRLTAKALYCIDGTTEQVLAYKPLYDYEIREGSAVITGYNGTDTVLNVPGWIGNYNVTAIGEGAFEGNTAITEVHLSGYTNSIGAKAFKNCTSLRWIDGEGVKEIGEEAFYNCISLVNIRFVRDKASIKVKKDAFEKTPILNQTADLMSIEILEPQDYSYNIFLGTVTYQEGIAEIPARTHYSNVRLHTVNLPKSLRTIGSEAFADCPVLDRVTLYDGVESIAEDAFQNSDQLVLYIYTQDMEAVSHAEQYAIDHGIAYEKIYDDPRYPFAYPEGTTVIKRKAHYEEKYLREVTLPESVERIESQAFAQCESLEGIYLYGEITSIADDAFEGSDGVHFIIYVEDMETVSYVEQYAIDHGISFHKTLKRQDSPETDQGIDTSDPTPQRVPIDVPRDILVSEIPAEADYVILYLDGERIGSFASDGAAWKVYEYTFRAFGQQVLTAEAYLDGEVIKLSWEKPVIVYGIRLTADRETAWTCEPVNFTVEAYPDATAVEFYAEDLPFGGTVQMEENSGSLAYAFTKAGNREITVRSDSGYVSGKLILPILCIGQLDQPVLEAEELQYVDDGLVCSWNTTENTDGYVLYVRYANGQDILQRKIEDDGSERMTCTISAEELGGEGTYQLYLMNYGHKYDQNESQTITVELTADKTPRFTMDKQSAETGDPVGFTFCAFDATSVELWADGEAIETISLSNSRGTLTRAFTQSGDRKMQIRALQDSAWTELSDVQILKVTSKGALAAVQVTAEPVQLLGNSIKASWTSVENADGYIVYFRNAAHETIYKLDTKECTVSVPADLVQQTGEYYFVVMAYGKGYDQSEGSATVTVAQHLPGPVILTPEENEACDDVSVDLTWQPVAGAEGYVVSLARKTEIMDANGQPVFEKVWAEPNQVISVGTSLSYQLAKLVFGETYRAAVGTVVTGPDGTERIGWSERIFTVALPELAVTLAADSLEPMDDGTLTLTATVNHTLTQAVLKDSAGAEVTVVSSGSVVSDKNRVFTFVIPAREPGPETYTVTVSGTDVLAAAKSVSASVSVEWQDANAAVITSVTAEPQSVWPGDTVTFTIVANANTASVQVVQVVNGEMELLATRYPAPRGRAAEDADENVIIFDSRSFSTEGVQNMQFIPSNEDGDQGEPYAYNYTVLPRGKMPAPNITNLTDGDILVTQGFAPAWDPVTIGTGRPATRYNICLYKWVGDVNPDQPWQVLPGYHNYKTDTQCSFTLPNLDAGGNYLLEVYSLADHETVPSTTYSGCTAVQFSYRTIPGFTLTGLQADGIVTHPVTVTWVPPVWQRDTSLKPDHYEVKWYLKEPGKAIPTLVHEEKVEQGLSAVLPGNKALPGNYYVQVQAVLGSEKQTATGTNTFTILSPRLDIQKAEFVPKEKVLASGTAGAGVTTVLLRLIRPDGKVADLVTAAGNKTSYVLAPVAADGTFAALLEADAPLAAMGGSRIYKVEAYGFLTGQKTDIAQSVVSDSEKFDVGSGAIYEVKSNNNEPYNWIFDWETAQITVLTNPMVTDLKLYDGTTERTDAKFTRKDIKDITTGAVVYHLFTSAGLKLSGEGFHRLTAQDAANSNLTGEVGVYVVTAENSTTVYAPDTGNLTIWTIPDESYTAKTTVAAGTELTRRGKCGAFVLVQAPDGSEGFVRENHIQGPLQIIYPVSKEVIDLYQTGEVLIRWKAHPDAKYYMVSLRVEFLNRQGKAETVLLTGPKVTAAGQNAYEVTFSKLEILNQFYERLSFKDNTWTVTARVDAFFQ